MTLEKLSFCLNFLFCKTGRNLTDIWDDKDTESALRRLQNLSPTTKCHWKLGPTEGPCALHALPGAVPSETLWALASHTPLQRETNYC